MKFEGNNKSRVGLLAFIASLGGFLFGYDTAVISGTVGFVKEKFILTSMAEGWFVSSALVGCIIGVSFAGIMSDRVGRKPTLLLSALLFSISAIGCSLIVSHTGLIAYRMIGGIGVGIASMVSPMYIAEISPAKIRGRLVALYQFAITIGILSAYFVNAGLVELSQNSIFSEGSLFEKIIQNEVWRSMFGGELIPAGLFFMLLLLVPESPRWLYTKGLVTKAEAALKRLGRQDDGMADIRPNQAQSPAQEQSIKTMIKSGFGIALLVGVVLGMLSQFSGINAIIYYGPRILEEAGISLSDALGGQVIIGIVNVIFTIVAIWKVDKFGRRGLLIVGASGAFLAHLVIGGLFAGGITQGYLVLGFILFFIACFAFSYGPVTWIYTSEIYPTRFRGRALSIVTLMLWAANALVGQLVPWMLEHITPAGTFWAFAVMCLPAIYLAVKVMPETKGKSLEEIEAFWIRKRINN